ncbi:MAG: efflux RND transporter periplasmic adaptor subunit [Planctomycetota bacterium]|nr:MAG: efflux RND transporter periplasmic adaptor subunit [Planctomycetota bacterium]
MRVPLGLSVLLASALLGACGPDAPEAGPAPAGLERPSPPAATGSAVLCDLPVERELAATVRSLDHIQAAAEVQGRVLRIHADVGDRVRAGQLLAELDDQPLRAAVDAAEAAVELARVEADRVRRLRDERVAPEREWDRAQTALRQAEAQLEMARIRLGKARVLAPVDAVVEARLVGPGDLAVPGAPLFRLYDPARICLEARLPVGDREHVGLGTELEWAIGDRSGRAAVSEVAPSADPRSRTIRIRVPLTGAGEEGFEPAPGDFGTLRYTVGLRSLVCVPAAAVRRVGQVEMVLVRSGRGWERRAVRTGRRLGEQVEILSGLAGGEEVGLP